MRAAALLAMLAVARAAPPAPVLTPAMNKDAVSGGLYKIANPPPGASPYVDASRHAHRGKYIEVYSQNISTRYSEVHWTMHPPVALPADFVARYKGKVVAITGYEADAVRQLPGGGEEHVPLYDQYDHHHCAYLHGAATRLVDVGPAGSPRTVDGHGSYKGRWEARASPETEAALRTDPKMSQIPTGAFLVDGNGGEYRMSLHGTAKGSAMLMQSPRQFQIQPMIINTKNPNGKGPGNWDLIPPGAYGAAARSFHRAPERSLYSPLLECPCTDRKVKVVTQHDTVESGVCPKLLGSADECFAAAAALGLTPMAKNTTQSSSAAPQGCYVLSTKDGYEVFFNSATASSVQCGPPVEGAPLRSTGEETEANSGVRVHLELDQGAGECTAAGPDLSGVWRYPGTAYGPTHAKASPYAVRFAAVAGKPGHYSVSPAADQAQQYRHMNTAVCATGCEATLVGHTLSMTGGFTMSANVSADWAGLTFTNGAPWRRPAKSCPGLATVTLTGPAGAWFGAGFDAFHMTDAYAIIVDGQGAVTERVMGNHDAGTQLSASVKVVSSSVAGGKRTVVLSRALAGQGKDYASFDAAAGAVPVIAAAGSGPVLGYHKARGGGSVMMVLVGAPLCVCPSFGTASGSIAGVAFNKHCLGAPRSSLLDEKNDICDIETYHGGLSCCSHGSLLLGSNQTVPPALDTYRMKFRVYYEDYVDQGNAFFMFVVNEAGAGEYDVPQCPPGTPTEQCVHTITGEFKLRDSMRPCGAGVITDVWCAPQWNESGKVAMLRAGTHCHAPACLNETLYNLDTGEAICYNEPLYGEGSFPTDGQHFDEKGYAVGIPPCVWGSAEEGLRTPPLLGLDTRLRSVKHVNNTFYHYGVMAQWQMRGMWAKEQ